MKGLISLTLLLALTVFAACDLRSGIAKDEMEKFSGTPTPTRTPAPTEEPVDPADVVKVDTMQPLNIISVSGNQKAQTVNCSKFDTVTINGGKSVVTIKGHCRQVTLNGKDNQLTAEGIMSIVLNGENNSVKYTKYVNGKRPSVTDNGGGNTVEKFTPTTTKK
ncbi:MAG TPA: DUF3060 domain-containing protein [Pyrinomonadaceae bacterium]|nr:DUF3060 domain-containing protein [Pyrinomonadaceae bacterium]